MSKVSSSIEKSVEDFFKKHNNFKKIQNYFEEVKTGFYEEMEEYFEHNNIAGKLNICGGFSGDNFEVARIQNSKVEFNPDKLEKALGKKLSSDVIQKHYEIIDMGGLITYLKECGVDPKVFKSFISVHKTVDMKELDRLEELGKISVEQVKGCYTVKKQKPRFTVKVKKDMMDE